MKTQILLLLIGLFLCQNSFSQGGFPWNNPLKMAWSTDGITFNTPTIFQDSSGVPSIIKWKGDTLIAAFQWFRQPNPSPSWDRVATKISYDNGLTWKQPSPIVVNGLPANYQRPFDPTLTVFNNDSLRIYFSSSDGMPMGGLDSTVNTYSAKSADGVNFYFEPNARVDELSNKVIDPAVIYFNMSWHYLAPIGAPQQGAYHYVSPNGINFSAVSDIPSDNNHNWTGNFMKDSESELRFYGCGQGIWYNSTSNGGVWNGYTNTNIQGGDPSVVKIANNNYLMVYVGQPYTTGIQDNISQQINVFPNPATDFITLEMNTAMRNESYHIYDPIGKIVATGNLAGTSTQIKVNYLPKGLYFIQIEGINMLPIKFIRE